MPLSSVRDTRFCRGGDGCLDVGHQSPAFRLSFFLFLPTRQLGEVAGPLCPTLGFVLFFCTSSTSQSDTVPHSAHFSPLLCQSTVIVNGYVPVEIVFSMRTDDSSVVTSRAASIGAYTFNIFPNDTINFRRKNSIIRRVERDLPSHCVYTKYAHNKSV